MFSLEDRDWYNTSQNTLEIAFQRIFIPWIDGHLYSTPENEDNDEDVNAVYNFSLKKKELHLLPYTARHSLHTQLFFTVKLK